MIRNIFNWTSNASAMSLKSALKIMMFPESGQLTIPDGSSLWADASLSESHKDRVQFWDSTHLCPPDDRYSL